jgi:hypothetical protein
MMLAGGRSPEGNRYKDDVPAQTKDGIPAQTKDGVPAETKNG